MSTKKLSSKTSRSIFESFHELSVLEQQRLVKKMIKGKNLVFIEDLFVFRTKGGQMAIGHTKSGRWHHFEIGNYEDVVALITGMPASKRKDFVNDAFLGERGLW